MKLALRALYTYHQKNVKSSNKNVKETWETTYPNKCAPVFYTVFENPRKSLIQLCERSELRLHFEWTKVHKKCQNSSQFWWVFENATFWGIFKHCVFNCEFETSLLAHIFSSTFNYSEETQPTQVSTHDLPGFEKMNSNFQKLGGVWR